MNTLSGLRVLISGAGVAGPALAYWLSRYGAAVTVVEVAPALRTSGFAVDFRGPTHLGVLARMGVLDELRELQTHGGAMRCVDERGHQIFELPAEFAGGDLEVLRRDLSRVLYERGAERVEYLFGDVITEAAQTGDGVRVTFGRHGVRAFDVLIGADGLHSGVRRIAFGPEERHVRHLGYYVAGWQVPGSPAYGTTSQQYNEPGRMISVVGDQRDPERANVIALFAGPRLEHDWHDVERHRRLIADALTGLRWPLAARLLDGLGDTADPYFDSISRVSVPAWSSGRVALLGDAAWGVTLGGMGVGTSIVGAYVLAGELAAAGGDHRAAFAAYENRMRPYAARWQGGANPGRFLAPATAFGLRLRNTLFGMGVVRRLMVSGTKSLATDIALPEYAPN